MSADFHVGWFTVGTLLFGRALLACAAMRRVPFVPERTPAEPAAAPTPVTVVVLAGGDADALRACIESAARQRGCAVDVVVVHDGPKPALRSPTVRTVEAPAEPADAVPWAAGFAAGAAAADAAWLCLLERPHRLHPDALARALAHASSEAADVVWLVPSVRTPAWVTPARLTSLADAMPAMAAANRDRETVHWPGLPILGRRNVLTAVLGEPANSHAPALEARLAARLRADGRRGRCALAPEEFDAGQLGRDALREAVERLLAGVGFRTSAVVAGVLLFFVLWLSALFGAVSDDRWGWFAAAGLASLAVPAWSAAHSTRASPWPALVAPLWFPVEAAVTLAVTWRIARRGTVRWRGRTIAVASLRARPDDPTA